MGEMNDFEMAWGHHPEIARNIGGPHAQKVKAKKAKKKKAAKQ